MYPRVPNAQEEEVKSSCRGWGWGCGGYFLSLKMFRFGKSAGAFYRSRRRILFKNSVQFVRILKETALIFSSLVEFTFIYIGWKNEMTLILTL